MTNKIIEPLLAERNDRAINTNKKLLQALDRFDQNRLKVIPLNSKLSLRNLALEAGVNKDTPFSRYKKDDVLVGTYRFPEVVARFKAIKAKIEVSKNKNSRNQIEELHSTIRDYEKKFIQQARIINLQDQKIVELENYCRSLESQIADFRR